LIAFDNFCSCDALEGGITKGEKLQSELQSLNSKGRCWSCAIAGFSLLEF